MPEQLRFGVIGCGEISVETCIGISAARNATIAMFMDVQPQVLQDLSELYGAPTTTDVDELLANPNVDAVYIAVPHDLHVPIGIKAAKAGKHVLVEKPISTNLPDADALIQTCKDAGVKLGVAFLAQVDGGCAAARDYIRAGLLGEIIAVRLTAFGDKPDYYWRGGYTQRVATTWRQSKQRSGGGILIMNLVHDINTVRWVTGLEVQRIYAEYDTLSTPVEVEDTFAATVRYSNGAIGSMQAGSLMRGSAHKDIRGPRIYGTKGQIILSDPPLLYSVETPEGGTPKTWSEMPYRGPKGDRANMITQFAQAVLEDRTPPCTGEDGRKALEIIVGAYRSGETKQPVELPLAR